MQDGKEGKAVKKNRKPAVTCTEAQGERQEKDEHSMAGQGDVLG